MATLFSTEFAASPETLVPGDFDYTGKEVLYDLETEGLRVVRGIQECDLAGIRQVAAEESVGEFHPEDVSNFYNELYTARWLAEHGGRAVFRLLDTTQAGPPTVAGYGWVAPVDRERYPENLLPDCEATLAVRMGTEYQNRGLGRRFVTAMVAGAMALGTERMGFAVWASNFPARKLAKVVGAEWVAGQQDWRTTRNVVIRGGKKPPGYELDVYRQDVIDYYQLPPPM